MPCIIERHTYLHNWAWANPFSMCDLNGSILKKVEELFGDTPFVVVQGDGFVREKDMEIGLRDQGDMDNLLARCSTVAILCTRGVNHPGILLLPLDDESFVRGVWDVVSDRIQRIPWETKKPIAYWRGCLSGGKAPTLRTNTVWDLHDFPHADVKLTRNVNMDYAHMGRLIFPEDTRFYDESRSLQDHIQHKYILILDGNCIASSLQWVFASGSVPVLVTHPENDWWFRKFLVDGFHCVSVKHDLSDLKDKIQYLVDHDAYAKQIAENSMEFAKTVLSSEFQNRYLLTQTAQRGYDGGCDGACGCDDDGDHPHPPP